VSIKTGNILFVGGGAVLDRLSTAGPGQVQIQRDKVYELGNRLAVGSIANTPDLSFSAESFDVSTETECVLTGHDFTSIPAGHVMKFTESVPIDIVSPFLPAATAASPDVTIGSVAIPYLQLESASYKFGINENASQTFSLKGDGLFYNLTGNSFVESFTGTNTANQVCTTAHAATVYKGDVTNGNRYALSVSLSTGERLTYGADYTEVSGGTLAVTILAAVPVTSTIRVLYASTATSTYAQAVHAADSATRPAAIRGRNIEVFIGGELLTNRWTSVQSAQVDWKVTLEKDEEFSNPNAVAQDYNVPDVSGSVSLKPRSYAELYAKICTVAGVTPGEVAGPLTTAPMEMLIKLKSPTNGAVLKQLLVPDARFNLPGYSAKVQSKLDLTFNWTSDTGDLSVIHRESGS
jgi:hypothetical protein